MHQQHIHRRRLLKLVAATAGLSFLPRSVKALPEAVKNKSFIYCLNTATIRGHNLGLMKELEVTSKAGFSSIEIWVDTLNEFISKGGKITDVQKKLKDLNLTVENAIGFAQWIVDDEKARNNGIEQMKREMGLLAAIGCTRTAAPPVGATDTPGLDLQKAAERYRKILEIGEIEGVIPQLELWGFSANLKKLSELMYVAVESGHSKAKVLLDNYHIYKGGTNTETLGFLNPEAIEVFHINDYPANISREEITDAHRIYAGDGVAPIVTVLQKLKNPAKPLILSFEVFNKTYYKQDPLEVAKTALAKMKRVTGNIS